MLRIRAGYSMDPSSARGHCRLVEPVITVALRVIPWKMLHMHIDQHDPAS